MPASPARRPRVRRPYFAPRTRRLTLLILTGLILAFAVLDAVVVLPVSFSYQGGIAVGMDYGIYMDRTTIGWPAKGSISAGN